MLVAKTHAAHFFPGYCLHSRNVGVRTAIPDSINGSSVFFHQRHTLSMSFGIFVVTYRVTNVLPKLVDMLLFFKKKQNFHFLKSLFSTIAVRTKNSAFVLSNYYIQQQ